MWFLAQPALDGDSWLGISDTVWFYTSLIIPIVQQILGWLIFRGQICFQVLTRVFGKADLAVWGVLFFPLLIGRFLALLGLAIADRGSLEGVQPFALILGILLLFPAGYTMWSTEKYFGVIRALGRDHFREKYRHMPLVREGMFRWSSNAMYSFAFLGLWAIALIAGSRAALAVALFQHAYVWVHMYCTEAPDLKILYDKDN